MSFTVPGDLELNDARTDVLLVQGGEEIRAAVDAGLQIFKGLWRYDQARGILDFRTLYGKPSDLGLWRASIWARVAETEGIQRVTGVSVSFDRAARKLSVVWAAEAVSGAVTSEVSFT